MLLPLSDFRALREDCAVCAKGFASRIQYKCEKCEEEEGGMALIAVFAVIVALLGLALIWYLILAENGLKGRGLVRRIMRNMPVQSIKIMIVVWQIITQVTSVDFTKLDLTGNTALAAGRTFSHHHHHRQA